MSRWNEFQRANKGKGYTRAEMSRLYRESQARDSTPAASSPYESITTDLDRLMSGSESFDTTSFSQQTRRPNAWNEFRREYARRELSMQELRELYYDQKRRPEFEIPSTPPATRRQENVPSQPATPTWSETARVSQRRPEPKKSKVSPKFQPPRNTESRPSLRGNGLQLHTASAESDRAKIRAAVDHRALVAEPERVRISRESPAVRSTKSIPTRHKAQHSAVSRRLFRENDDHELKPVELLRESSSLTKNRRSGSPKSGRFSNRLNRDQGLLTRVLQREEVLVARPVPDDGGVYFNPSRVLLSTMLDGSDLNLPSSVWAGEVDGFPVAVRIIGPTTVVTEDSLRKDVSAMMRAENQHTVTPLGYTHVESVDGSLALAVVMDFMPGGDLRSAIRQGQLNLKQKSDVLFQVLDALEFLHRQNIAHRHLNPSTILLSQATDVAKLRDFGISTYKIQGPTNASSFRSIWHDSDAGQDSNIRTQDTQVCTVCTFINPQSSQNCEMCAAELVNIAATSASLAGEDWECIKCTLVNKCTNEVCKVCGGSKLATIESNNELEKLLLETVRDSTPPSDRAAAAWYLPPEVNNSGQHFEDYKKFDIFSFTVLVAEMLLEADCPVPTQDGLLVRLGRLRVNGRHCPCLEELIEQGWNQDPKARPDVDAVRRQLTRVFEALGV